MSIINRHWRGNLPLGISVVLVFVALSLAFHLLQPVLLTPLLDQPKLYLATMVSYVMLTCFVIFPWQLFGVLRALDRHYLRFGNNLVLYGVQAVLICGLILTISLVVGNAQTLKYYWDKEKFETRDKTQSYSLTVSENGKALRITGLLDFGITKSAQSLLLKHPDISTVELDSAGGQIYEGRGLAKLFQQHVLNTYTYKQCTSSCTTAFIGGQQRYLGEGAKLGFHQYAIDQNRQRQTTAVYDLQQEQRTDIEFFRSQGIQSKFLNQVFETPDTSMWYPDAQLLIETGVIQAVVKIPE